MRKITWRCMFEKTKKKKKIASKTSMPPDQKSLTMKILRAQLVSHSWVNCPDCN